MSKPESIFRKEIIGWSLYDFANTIYSMNIVSLYLKRYIVEDLHKDHLYFDVPFSLSMIFAAILLPALGAISDHAAKKKIFVMLFTFTCCISVGVMAFIPSHLLILILILFIIANFCYEAAQPFYNSLLYSVSDGNQARFVSGFGVALGYIGSVVGMIIVLPFVTGKISIPFLSNGGFTSSFLPTAILFILFSLPLFYWVKEKENIKKSKIKFISAYKEVWEGIRETKKYPGVLRFLIADYFFEDAVTTVILNIGIYCSVVIGFEESMITTFLIISTVSAVIGSFIIGKLSQNFSLKKMLNMIVIGWIISLLIFIITDNKAIIWVIGSFVGILLGGLWTTSRPMLAELVPRDELGRFYGLFALSGRAAAVVGPLIWTTILYFFDANRFLGQLLAEWLDLNQDSAENMPYKLGVLSLVFMMAVGLYIFRKVPESKRGLDV